MKSAIADAVALRFPPLAIFYAQEPPSEGKEANGLCAMIPIAQASKGETVYFPRRVVVVPVLPGDSD